MNINQIGKLTDESRMPFGKNSGERMADVSPDYFRYLWNNGMNSEQGPVPNYIREHLEDLMSQCDGDWEDDGL